MASGVPIDYAKVAAEANAAVKAILDPELRKIAFEKILEDLLSSAASGPSHKKPETKVRHGEEKPTAPKKRKKAGPQTYIEELVEEGFFKKTPKTLAEIKAELGNRGHHIEITHLGTPLRRLCTAKKLRRQKIQSEKRKGIYGYSNW